VEYVVAPQDVITNATYAMKNIDKRIELNENDGIVAGDG